MSEPRTLPSSHKAEQALLGILLFENTAIERVPIFFRAEHMFDQVHAQLCKAIIEAIQSGGSANPIMLQERFGSDEAFRDMGGFSYLADLVDHAPSVDDTGSFCHLITDLHTRRRMIAMAEKMLQGAYTDRLKPALDQASEFEREMFELTTLTEEGGPQQFSDVLSAALETAAAAYNREGDLAGLPTGIGDLDAKLGGLRDGNLIILAARPSMGKTALGLNIATTVSKQYTVETVNGEAKVSRGGVAVMFSLEMGADELGLRVLAEESGISGERITGGRIDASEFGRLRDAAVEIGGCPLYIDATGAISLSAIATRCRRLKRTVGLNLVVIDYLQLVTAGDAKGMAPHERIAMVTAGLKALAKELAIPVIALSQVSRGVEQRPDKRPILSDLRESGAIEQDADVVIFVYRDSYYLERESHKEGTEAHMKWEEALEKSQGLAELIIAKQRHGSVGTVKVAFNPELTKFSNTIKDEEFKPRSAS